MDRFKNNRVKKIQMVLAIVDKIHKLLTNLELVQEKVVGMNRRNSQLIYPNNPRKFFPLADDKILCKELLEKNGIPTPNTYIIIEKMGELDMKWDTLPNVNAICIKPAMGSGGGGILILKKQNENKWQKPSGQIIEESEIRMHLANILFGTFSFASTDRAIVEYCLNPHPFFSDIYAHGVPDFRVIIYNQKPIMAMLRMPNDRSEGKANLHMGAIGIGIDLSNGKLKMGYDGKKHINKHPDSKIRFEGKRIPQWHKTLEIAQMTAKLFPLNYLGVDIVFDRDFGPLVIEVNARPGIEIQNVNKKGLGGII